MFKNLKPVQLLSLSLGIVYLWFGTLKFFPELSPAEGLAIDTIHELTFGVVPQGLSIILLALVEVLIGISFLFNIYRKQMILVALAHLVCTFTPLFFFSEISFNGSPIALTLVGQYIIKNLVLVAVLLSIFKFEKRSFS
ncbi:hypothetical protein [Maribacter sp. 2210JD10-5]|uniref:hypothetical protein n=1 Tax=Maribacter sp. 2210JD10-5 TaxID=3386272 RepID=UPI0039BD4B25